MSDLILRRDHGLQLDHIGLGVPDVKEGVAWVEAQTGAEVMLHDAEPGQWYQSGSLAIGGGSFLEIIGPNPAHRKFQPFGALLSTLDRPRLAFWYIAVHDFDAFQALAKRKGGALERVEHINIDHCTPNQSGYHRGYVGPGFMT
ncbi:MAG: VOC family protein [Pseudomonadota bacterium]